jgi:hypothetical protein
VSGVANDHVVDSSNDVDEGHSKKRENPLPQRPSNNTIPPSVGGTRTRQRERVLYDEEEVKNLACNIIEKVQEVFDSTNHPNESPRGIATDSPLLQMACKSLKVLIVLSLRSKTHNPFSLYPYGKDKQWY